MKFGVQIFMTDYSIGPVELAREVERRGYESLWVPEHTHIPASRETPYPGGGDLPQEYWHCLDPFVALTAASAATHSLKLGFGLCLLMERDPITTAKAVATLDHISGGRVLFGVGGGWNREEMRNHGTDPQLRWRVLCERVLAVKAIWTEEEASYHGDHVDFNRIWSWPKPHQRPHPPVLVGGDGAGTLDRVIEYGDEWIPISMGATAELAAKIAELQRRAAVAGRPPIPVTVGHVLRIEADEVARYEAMGVQRLVLMLPSAEPERVFRRLDVYDHLRRAVTAASPA